MAILQCSRAPFPKKAKNKNKSKDPSVLYKFEQVTCKWVLSILGGTKHCSTKAETISRGGSASRTAKWGCPGATAHLHRASSSMKIYDQLPVTPSGVELSQVQRFCLCYHPPPQQHQQWNESSANTAWLWSCRSASPASLCISCLMHFQLSTRAAHTYHSCVYTHHSLH